VENSIGEGALVPLPAITQGKEADMQYDFKCQEHGEFEVSQPIMAEHTASCPECGVTAQRVFSPLQCIWAGSVFRSDGSYREQNDYAALKG